MSRPRGWAALAAGADPWRRPRLIALALSTLLVCAGLALPALHRASVAATQAAWAGSSPTTPGPVRPATMLVRSGFTDVDHHTVRVITLVPLTPSTPAPPGATRFPDPGEVIVSPGVAALAGGGASLGRVAGRIDPGALVTGNELRVYHRPLPQAVDRRLMQPSAGFDPGGEGIGPPPVEMLQHADPLSVRALTTGALLLPGLAGLVGACAAGLGAFTARRRRLVAVGASPAQLVVLALRAALPGVLAGGVLALLLLLAPTVTGARLGWVEARYTAAELAGARTAVVAAVLAGTVLSAVVVTYPALLVLRRRPGTRDLDQPERVSAWRPVVFALSVALAVVAPPLMPPRQGRALVYLVGVTGAALTLSAVLALLLERIGRAARALGHRRGSPGLITGGAALQARPVRLARLLLPACVAILLLGQAQLWTTLLGGQYYQGIEAQHAARGQVVVSPPLEHLPDQDALQGFRSAGLTPVWLVSSTARGAVRTTWQADCPDLRRLALPCTPARGIPTAVSATPVGRGLLAESQGALDTRPVPGPTLSQDSETVLALVSPGRAVDLPAANRLAAGLVPGDVRLTPVAHSWVAGGQPGRVHGSWVVLWSVLGVGVLLGVAALLAALDALGQASRLAPVAAAASRRDWPVVHALVAVALPFAAAGLLTVGTYLLLPVSMSSGDARIEPSGALAGALLGVTAVWALAAGAAVAAATGRAGRDWRPGAGGLATPD